jgi:mycofactocin precursor
MEQDTTVVADPESVVAIARDQAGDTTDLVEEELLIEEISIDGMCGVY